jgi:hypothetical protein
MRNISRPVALVAGFVLFASLSNAQFGRGGGAWNTAGADAQRSSWARTDARISAASMPGFSFLWKVQVNNDAKQAYSLSQAVMVDAYIGYRGFRSYAFLAGSSNNVIALDSDIGRMEWTKNFGQTPVSSPTCPGAMTAGVTRTASFTPAAAPAPGGGRGGRGPTAAASGVGEPEKGAITIRDISAAAGGPGGPGGFAGGRGASGVAGRGGPGGPGGGGRGAPNAVYAISTDGMLRTLYISNGTEALPAVRFLPANANASGIILADGMIYTSTSGNCGGAPNGVWAIDTTAAGAAPIHWGTNGGGVAGTVGPAFGSDGSIYAATSDGDYSPTAFSDSVVVLDGKTLKLKDWFSPAKSEFTSSPVVFPYKERDLVAVANKDGRLYLLDSKDLGGGDHKTPLAVSTQYANSGAGADALATWEDTSGTRWILVSVTGALNSATHFPVANGSATAGAIAAFKLVEQNGKPTLQPGWVSRDIAAPQPPIVVNGIVFAVASGAQGGNAVLYALDGSSGKDIWNSASTITSQVRSGGLAASAGQLYLGTMDNTLYAFGIPLVPPHLAEKNK